MEFQQILQDALGTSLISGLLLFALFKVWAEYKEEKNKKDTLAEALVKISLLWDDKYSKDSIDDRDIKVLMQEIRDLMKRGASEERGIKVLLQEIRDLMKTIRNGK